MVGEEKTPWECKLSSLIFEDESVTGIIVIRLITCTRGKRTFHKHTKSKVEKVYKLEATQRLLTINHHHGYLKECKTDRKSNEISTLTFR